MEISDENFERITSLAFENGYREGYMKCLQDIKKEFDCFAINAVERAERYRIKNTDYDAKMDGVTE